MKIFERIGFLCILTVWVCVVFVVLVVGFAIAILDTIEGYLIELSIYLRKFLRSGKHDLDILSNERADKK